MWTTMKNNLLGKKNFWVVPPICTGFVNTCPTVFLQYIFVIPEFIMKRPVYTLFPQTRQLRPSQSSLNVSPGMEEQACPEVTGSNATTRLTLLWARNTLRGNSDHWQASQEKAWLIIPKRRKNEMNKCTHWYIYIYTHTFKQMLYLLHFPTQQTQCYWDCCLIQATYTRYKFNRR